MLVTSSMSAWLGWNVLAPFLFWLFLLAFATLGCWIMYRKPKYFHQGLLCTLIPTILALLHFSTLVGVVTAIIVYAISTKFSSNKTEVSP